MDALVAAYDSDSDGAAEEGPPPRPDHDHGTAMQARVRPVSAGDATVPNAAETTVDEDDVSCQGRPSKRVRYAGARSTVACTHPRTWPWSAEGGRPFSRINQGPCICVLRVHHHLAVLTVSAGRPARQAPPSTIDRRPKVRAGLRAAGDLLAGSASGAVTLPSSSHPSQLWCATPRHVTQGPTPCRPTPTKDVSGLSHMWTARTQPWSTSRVSPPRRCPAWHVRTYA